MTCGGTIPPIAGRVQIERTGASVAFSLYFTSRPGESMPILWVLGFSPELKRLLNLFKMEFRFIILVPTVLRGNE